MKFYVVVEIDNAADLGEVVDLAAQVTDKAADLGRVVRAELRGVPSTIVLQEPDDVPAQAAE